MENSMIEEPGLMGKIPVKSANDWEVILAMLAKQKYCTTCGQAPCTAKIEHLIGKYPIHGRSI